MTAEPSPLIFLYSEAPCDKNFTWDCLLHCSLNSRQRPQLCRGSGVPGETLLISGTPGHPIQRSCCPVDSVDNGSPLFDPLAHTTGEATLARRLLGQDRQGEQLRSSSTKLWSRVWLARARIHVAKLGVSLPHKG